MAGITLTLAVLAAVIGSASPAGAAPAIGCGSVVTRNLTLQSDLAYCVGDGLIVGKAGITIDLNGHAIFSRATQSSAFPVLPGSAGIRNAGFPRVKVQDTTASPPAVGGNGWIGGFAFSILVTDASRMVIDNVAALDGMRLERSDKATIRNSELSSTNQLGCDPLTAPAGISLIDSNRAIVRGNESQLGGLGIVLVRSHNNVLQGNASAGRGSDGNDCGGIVLIDADGNTLRGNDTSETAADGIFVDAASQRTLIDGNYSEYNHDDGIDVENATTTILNTTTFYSTDLAIEAVPGVTASGNRAAGSGNPLVCSNVVCT
jgi:parallel beta-helix repeat protein